MAKNIVSWGTKQTPTAGTSAATLSDTSLVGTVSGWWISNVAGDAVRFATGATPTASDYQISFAPGDEGFVGGDAPLYIVSGATERTFRAQPYVEEV